MAIEAKRGCGYRKVGGLYFEGPATGMTCDRLPLMLDICPVCGNGIKVGRGFTRINPLQLWAFHIPCNDQYQPCPVCQPPDETAYIMLVGEKYYKSPNDFTLEAGQLGISKRIPYIPRDFVIGKTIIYLAHYKACELKEAPVIQQAMDIFEEHTGQTRMLDSEKVQRVPGIFGAFIPQRIVQLCWEKELSGFAGAVHRENLAKRGITAIAVPDGDLDHKPSNNDNED